MIRYIYGQKFEYFIGQLYSIVICFLLQDSQPGLIVRSLKISLKSPFKPGKKSLLHSLKLNGRSVACKNQLFAGLMKVVEDMKESILRFFFTGKFMYLSLIHI